MKNKPTTVESFLRYGGRIKKLPTLKYIQDPYSRYKHYEKEQPEYLPKLGHKFLKK